MCSQSEIAGVIGEEEGTYEVQSNDESKEQDDKESEGETEGVPDLDFGAQSEGDRGVPGLALGVQVALDSG